MVLVVRQLPEKCREQNNGLHVIFVDLTKALDTVNRSSLWKIIRKFDFPESLIYHVASFHDDMRERVQENSDTSGSFPVEYGVKQGCVLTPAMFSILFAAMLTDIFKDYHRTVQHTTTPGQDQCI